MTQVKETQKLRALCTLPFIHSTMHNQPKSQIEETMSWLKHLGKEMWMKSRSAEEKRQSYPHSDCTNKTLQSLTNCIQFNVRYLLIQLLSNCARLDCTLLVYPIVGQWFEFQITARSCIVKRNLKHVRNNCQNLQLFA